MLFWILSVYEHYGHFFAAQVLFIAFSFIVFIGKIASDFFIAFRDF
jgi:hypothetical protein